MTTRRDFLKAGAAVSGAAIAGGLPNIAGALERDMRPASMNLLIFGGTGFIGPHLVRRAVERGHKVTIFSRGRHDADIPSSVDRLIGDRAPDSVSKQSNLTALKGKRFDAVIDDPASDPQWVRESADLLKTSGSYLFVSSTGVYLPYNTPNADETAPVELVPSNGSAPQYGNNKAQCEKIVMDTFGAHGQVVRPAYIIGPGDTTDRFCYWPQRLKKGGETFVPGKGTERIAIVDVRDLVDFMLKLVEEKKGGIYNVTGPKDDTTFSQFMDRAQKALNTDAKLVWVDDYDFLRTHGIGQMVPWTRLDGANLYHTVLSNKKAVAAGLTFRPMEETIRDIWNWWPERLKLLPAGQEPRFQLRAPGGRGGRGAAGAGAAPASPPMTTEEYEQKVLADWKARAK
ncbi:MAG TPA: NAD-dependent epimerase/dehydratase family protein [Gemmatimonadaceae bacterium]|nr:NAD-dependent epimerase/dehydratase family protein [Gemmatimonadaceae bacterium]